MHVYLLPSSAHPSIFCNEVLENFANDEDILARVVSTISHVADHGGHPDGTFAKKLKGVDMCEVRCKCHYEELLRIYYYVDKVAGKMLLLNYILKPDGSNSSSMYEGKALKKLEKEIQESIQVALDLRNEYPSHHPHYEPLNLQ